MLDETTVVFCSEFGRSPELNGDRGKDHHPWTSMLFVGKGVRPGVAVGQTDGHQEGVKVNFATGRPDDAGQVIDVQNIVAGILTLVGANRASTSRACGRSPRCSRERRVVLPSSGAARHRARARRSRRPGACDALDGRVSCRRRRACRVSGVCDRRRARRPAVRGGPGARRQSDPAVPGTAEIRVYDRYATSDGSTLDEGRLWATVEGVRATGAKRASSAWRSRPTSRRRASSTSISPRPTKAPTSTSGSTARTAPGSASMRGPPRRRSSRPVSR